MHALQRLAGPCNISKLKMFVNVKSADYTQQSRCVTTTVAKSSAVDKPIRLTQPFILSGSINRVPALIGWGKGGNVTSAGWQVTLCDTIWHVSSRSGEASYVTLRVYLYR